MRRYLFWSLIPMTGLLSACFGRGGFSPEGPDGSWPMMHHGFGYGGMFMWVLWIIVIGLLIFFIVRAQKTKSGTPPENESPLDLLKRRYAKGEITREEYERVKKDLEG